MIKEQSTEPNKLRSKIIIVEDDPLMAVVYKILFLREEGRFSCTLEKNAEDALYSLRRGQADALILDWDLPGMSGLKLLVAIRTSPETKCLPVIIVSGRAGVKDRNLALKKGANDYFSKPFNTDELFARLKALVHGAKAIHKSSSKQNLN